VTPEPNRRWATDLTTVWTRRDGWVAVVPTIDCGCRSVLALAVTKDQSAPAILRSVDDLLGACFGAAAAVPDGLELRTDHGPQYTGQDCADLVTRWGPEHTLAPVGRPMGNVVVERVIRHDGHAELCRPSGARTPWRAPFTTRFPGCRQCLVPWGPLHRGALPRSEAERFRPTDPRG
jgi:transposase InsO family protein